MIIRKITLWVDSVPSPGKSKILSEIKVRVDYSENRLTCFYIFAHSLLCEVCFSFLFSVVAMQSAACQTHMQSEKTTICKAWNLDSMSTW